MGIYIKGISIPEFGEKIIILTSSGYVEDVSGQVINGVEVIPVPEHGRLGDLNELFKRMFVGTNGQCYPDKDVDGFDHVYTFRVIKHEILSAPTIIPADKEGEG